MHIYSNSHFLFRFDIPVIFDLLLTDVIFSRLGITTPMLYVTSFSFYNQKLPEECVSDYMSNRILCFK
jgi:hypothetical protein